MVCLVAEIVDGSAACQCYRRCPQGIVGHGDEDLVAVIQQTLHGHGDQLADAVAGVDVRDAHARDLFELAVLHDGLAGREHTLGIGVTLRVLEIVDHIHDYLVGGHKAVGGGVSDVELYYIDAIHLHTGGLVEDLSADVVADVVKFFGFFKSLHISIDSFGGGITQYLIIV